MCGRQVGKSVSAAAFEIVDSIAIPHFKTLYISPSLKQTASYSVSRVGKMLKHSPRLGTIFKSRKFTDNVFLKMLPNGSELQFSYASDDPDRVRGLSADRVIYDEVQDILYDEVMPVVNECLANSRYGFLSYMGTPKTMDNTIQFLWERSTRSEWCVPCDGCNKSSFYRTTKGVGKKGITCLSCGKSVNPRNGRWIDMQAPHFPDGRMRPKGFHVPQLILPANNENPDRWDRILDKYDTYSETRFKNEVLGVSDSIGSRLISLEELNSSCIEYIFEQSPTAAPTRSHSFLVGGVDWSGGGTKGHSRTVAWIWGVSPGGKYHTLWYRIFPVENPVATVAEIARVMNVYGVNMVFGDSGEGHLANSELRNRLGQGKMMPIQLGDFASTGAVIKWNGRDRYLVDRTALIDNFLMDVKKKRVVYANQSLMQPAFSDMLNVYEEVMPSGKKVWRHAPAAPDDALMAQMFGWIGCKVLNQDLTFYA
jgi:hypothetical protein